MSVHAHHEAADSVMELAHAHAEELKAHDTCLADELAHHFVDALPEPYSQGGDQVESADGVFWIYMATIGAVIAAAVVAVLS